MLSLGRGRRLRRGDRPRLLDGDPRGPASSGRRAGASPSRCSPSAAAEDLPAPVGAAAPGAAARGPPAPELEPAPRRPRRDAAPRRAGPRRSPRGSTPRRSGAGRRRRPPVPGLGRAGERLPGGRRPARRRPRPGPRHRAVPRGTEDELLAARLFNIQASLLGDARRFDLAETALDLVFAIHRRRGDKHQAGRALIKKGIYAGYQGNPERGPAADRAGARRWSTRSATPGWSTWRSTTRPASSSTPASSARRAWRSGRPRRAASTRAGGSTS